QHDCLRDSLAGTASGGARNSDLPSCKAALESIFNIECRTGSARRATVRSGRATAGALGIMRSAGMGSFDRLCGDDWHSKPEWPVVDRCHYLRCLLARPRTPVDPSGLGDGASETSAGDTVALAVLVCARRFISGRGLRVARKLRCSRFFTLSGRLSPRSPKQLGCCTDLLRRRASAGWCFLI